jgi:hypothetical protein
MNEHCWNISSWSARGLFPWQLTEKSRNQPAVARCCGQGLAGDSAGRREPSSVGRLGGDFFSAGNQFARRFAAWNQQTKSCRHECLCLHCPFSSILRSPHGTLDKQVLLVKVTAGCWLLGCSAGDLCRNGERPSPSTQEIHMEQLILWLSNSHALSHGEDTVPRASAIYRLTAQECHQVLASLRLGTL